MNKIILTIQSTSDKWRLGLNKSDSEQYFKHLESVLFIMSQDVNCTCNAACGTSRKKSFDFNNKKLSQWITDNNFHKYPPRKPIKLIFELSNENNKKVLKFVKKQTSP